MSMTFTKNKEEGDPSPELMDFYENWLSDEGCFKEYDKYDILRGDVLIRVFRYVPEEDGDTLVLDEYGIPYTASQEVLTALGKVIKCGPDCKLGLSPGDIVALPDGIALRTYNPKYLDYVAKNGDTAIPKGEHPPVFIYGIEKWNGMIFIADKLNGAAPEDEFTFIVPEDIIKAKVNI